MCGIIGYIGEKNAAPFLYEGLKRLEYRGYDSAGIATIDSKVHLVKDVGRVEAINEKLKMSDLPGKIGIGHTRWSTHGYVTKENAHPHISNNGKIILVHNGIIENYQELRKFLLSKGFNFYSETDTEVISNLIEYYMKGNSFIDAVKLTLKSLVGSYALAIINSDEKKLIAARKESPLVIGVGDKEYFVASNIPAFLDHTKKVIYLSDGDIAILDNEIKIHNLKQGDVTREISTISWSAEQAKKGNFEHFMLKEISEQADVINKAIAQDKEIIYEIANAIKNARGIYFVGCGTAYHACLAGSYLFSRIAKKHVNVCLGSEFPNFKHFLTPQSLVIAVSQSGETADTIAAIKAAKSRGAKVISILNVMGSTLARESDKALLQHAGPEICVLSTKSYTSQLTILTLLAYALIGKFKEAKLKLKDLIKYIYYLTSKNMRDNIRKLSIKLKDAKDIYTIGRGLQYPTAIEAALKIKEVSYIHAEGFAGGELKHGTIALIEKGAPCIVFSSEDTKKEIISNAMEIKSRGGYIIGIAPEDNEVFDFFIKVRAFDEANPICQIIPIQILAYQLAVLRGCDPDKPRNLAKSVTVR